MDKNKSTTGLSPKTAAALSYFLVWLSGLFFFLVEKDSFVKFHAMQSIVFFGFLTIVPMVPILSIFTPLFWIAGFVLWFVLIIKAYRGEKYKLPIIGNFAEKLLGKIK